jgi:hypothetical protein
MYTARLADYYPDRFVAFAFLGVGYEAPSLPVKYEDLLRTVCEHLITVVKFLPLIDKESMIRQSRHLAMSWLDTGTSLALPMLKT